MKFGVFYEMQLPRPWHAHSEYQLFQNALDQVELADRLGFDFAWEVEHHFLEEYSHSSAPEVFLAAASQRTKQIRLAHGIVQLTTNHPARVAERVSTLDLLSHGRVELGIGEGSTPTELHPFGRRFRDKRLIWEDAVRALIPMFTEEASEYKGDYFEFPLRNVVPKPLQRPHPPLWVACSQLETIEMAGRRGIGALAFQFISPEAAQAWVHAYYNAFVHRQEKLANYQSNPNIAVVTPFMCAQTDEEAERRAEGWSFFQFTLGVYSRQAPQRPGSVDLWGEYQKWLETAAGQRTRGIGLIGSPDTIRRRLKQFEASNVDQVILLNQAGKNTHEHICESLEMFAREVMPEFHGREPEHQKWKEEILQGRQGLEDIDTSRFLLRAGSGTRQSLPPPGAPYVLERPPED
jgi:alkanesulfonate monooxygenase SsuD/methylene tetrahydromethanopterin reductase-like flavin-dependent oxidoreductase (luciferase family)